MQREKEGIARMISFKLLLIFQRSKLLQIGVNYIGQAEALQGCIEDVQRMKRFLLGELVSPVYSFSDVMSM